MKEKWVHSEKRFDRKNRQQDSAEVNIQWWRYTRIGEGQIEA